MVIPKAGTVAHLEEDRGAVDVNLGDGDLAHLDRAFPAPRAPGPLEML